MKRESEAAYVIIVLGSVKLIERILKVSEFEGVAMSSFSLLGAGHLDTSLTTRG